MGEAAYTAGVAGCQGELVQIKRRGGGPLRTAGVVGSTAGARERPAMPGAMSRAERVGVPGAPRASRPGGDRSILGQVMDDLGQGPVAYVHIHSVLARRITDGEYPAGAKLPTERELAEEFGCEPGTAALALRALQREGLARRIFRKGYFSSGPRRYPG